MIKSTSFQPTRFTTVPHSGSPSPDWQCLADADPLVRDWLFDPGSLTRRLIQLRDDHFGVRVLLQGEDMAVEQAFDWKTANTRS